MNHQTKEGPKTCAACGGSFEGYVLRRYCSAQCKRRMRKPWKPSAPSYPARKGYLGVEVRDEAKRLRQDGLSYNQIAERLQVRRGTAWKLVNTELSKRRDRRSRPQGSPAFDPTKRRWVVTGRKGKEYYYRIVMAAHLGRELRSNEHVHHINGDSTDDRLENLQLLSRSDHLRLHGNNGGRRVKWARGFDRCRECGNDQRRHDGLGLCGACYQRMWSQRRKGTR